MFDYQYVFVSIYVNILFHILSINSILFFIINLFNYLPIPHFHLFFHQLILLLWFLIVFYLFIF